MTGNFDSAFLLAGSLMLLGALLSLTFTNRPIGSVAFETASPALEGAD
jgi:hypothetical protein